MSMFRRDEGGQSVVLIAVSLPLILSLLLLVIDGGRLYVERERIRNAAQLAAEAAVSLAADQPGNSQPKDADVRGIVAEALQRNLPGEGYVADVVIPFRTDIPTFNVKVSVTKLFRASINAVSFRIGADGAAKLGDAPSVATPGATRTPPPAPTATPTPSPTARPTASPTPSPTPTPAPTATPRVAVSISGLFYTDASLGSSYYAACRTPSVGCFYPVVNYTWPPGTSDVRYFTDGRPGIHLYTSPGEAHVYRVDFTYFGGRVERISVPVTWPLNGTPYRSSAYSVTVSR